MKKIDDAWFYTNPHFLLRFCLVYVNGDAIVLVPLSILIILVALFSIKVGLIMASLFYTLLGLGEMIYWLLQQFGKKTYRPDDWGFSEISNDAVYILYQIRALADMVIGGTILIVLLKWYFAS